MYDLSEITGYYDGLKQSIKPNAFFQGYISNIQNQLESRHDIEGYKIQLLKKFELLSLFLGYFYLPYNNAKTYITLNKYAIPKLQSIENSQDYSPGYPYLANEIFDIVINICPRNAYYIIGKITNEAGCSALLRSAIDKRDKSLFVDTINERNYHIDESVNRLCYYFKNHISNKLTDILYELVPFDPNNDTKIEVWEILIDQLLEYIRCSYQLTFEEITRIRHALFSSFHQVEQVFSSFQSTDDKLCAEVSNGIEKFTKQLFFTVLSDKDFLFDLSTREAEWIHSLTQNEKLASILEQWRKEYEQHPLLLEQITEQMLPDQESPASEKPSGCVEEQHEGLSMNSSAEDPSCVSLTTNVPPQLSPIPGISREQLEKINYKIEKYCTKNGNFEYFFGDGEYDEKEGPLLWKGDWLALEYFIKVLYCGMIQYESGQKSADGKLILEQGKQVPPNTWKIASQIFVDRTGKRPSSMGTNSLDKLKKHSSSSDIDTALFGVLLAAVDRKKRR